tara:strand:+ start:221 stop:487 length:267 start_codon:yes stop_codon:yes gene_type:complete
MNHNQIRKFICSSEYFSGFNIMIDLTEINTIDDILIIFKNHLINCLQNHNFERLIDIANNRHFHIHSYLIEDILNSNPNEIFYICDHC